MIDFLASFDVALFVFINQVLSNPVGDVVWPIITDYDKLLPVRIALIAVWLGLLMKGGRRGRTAALLLIPLLVCADQLSSSLVKEWVQRPRPCHWVGGAPVIPHVHLLVHCGGGKAFPSSHAVNNFAVATLFAWAYRKYAWTFFLWALLVAVSRIAVGVHYPTDIAGGAALGCAVAVVVIAFWTRVEGHLPRPIGTKPPRGETM